MPRGGVRPGAGRKAGSKNRLKPTYADVAEARTIKAIEGGESPLAFLLSVMRDVRGDPELRVEAAKAAAPYVHKKQPQAVEVDGKVTVHEPVVLIHTAPPEATDGA